jgi:2-polyprenyl-6-methoxyphenol hydroxylase-like FAD-dependent oxidoreductase
VSQTPDELTSILTDRDGHTHRVSLGPGEMNDRWISDTKERATEFLPPVLAGVVGLTKQMFVQAIFDLAVPRMVFDRVVLLGDAACVVRPHTASGTSKAAGDALALAHALRDGEGDIADALGGWETERLVVARHITSYGKMIGERGGLGGYPRKVTP